jgi:tRNA (guanosine-2'-O-)-methyltransferase
MIERGDYPDDSETRDYLLDVLGAYLTPERNALFDKILSDRTRFLTVVTEDLYQEHNASAILRSCDCFGVQDMYSIQDRNEFRHTEKISRGAEKWVDMIEFSSDQDPSMMCMDMLRLKGYTVVATTPHEDGVDLNELVVDRPMALFFGSEKPGLSNDVLENADIRLRIPMYGFTESFNVSVAVALILNKMVAEMHKLERHIWGLTADEKKELKLLWILRTIQSPEFLLKRHLEKRP